MGLIRFLRGARLLGQTEISGGMSICEHAEKAGVEIPTNCTSGTCGTCMVTLLEGKVPIPNPIPPGLDDEMIQQNAVLGCICIPEGTVDIDILPPL